MKFHLGSFPELSGFPDDDSWQKFDDKEESLWLLQFRLLPLAIINMVCMILLWFVFTPVTSLLDDISFPETPVGFFICLVSVLIIHEMIHLAVHPKLGFSHRSIIGFWPSKMFLYVTYNGEISRNRNIAVFLMPFIMISIIPFLISVLINYMNIWLVYITILNAFLSALDILAAITFFKLPGHTVIWHNGRNVYWRENICETK